MAITNAKADFNDVCEYLGAYCDALGLDEDLAYDMLEVVQIAAHQAAHERGNAEALSGLARSQANADEEADRNPALLELGRMSRSHYAVPAFTPTGAPKLTLVK